MVVFRLSRPAVLRITIVRVYPTCKRVGAFTIRAHAGLNRIPFRGRLRGRALPEGGYRLIVRARGARSDAAAVPVVIARGAIGAKALRKIRGASVCSEPVADFEPQNTAPVAPTSDHRGSGGGVLGRIKAHLTAPLASAARAVARTTRGVSHRVSEASDDPLEKFVLTLVGTIVLTSSILGTIVLTRIVRTNGFRGV
jgi:hypothetical protein